MSVFLLSYFCLILALFQPISIGTNANFNRLALELMLIRLREPGILIKEGTTKVFPFSYIVLFKITK